MSPRGVEGLLIFLRGHVVDRSDQTLGTEPRPLDERVPVDPREEVLLEVVVDRARLVLRPEVRRERFLRDSTVLELGEPTTTIGVNVETSGRREETRIGGLT